MGVAENIIIFFLIVIVIGVFYPVLKKCQNVDFRIKLARFFRIRGFRGQEEGERLQEDETENNIIQVADRIIPSSPPPPYDWSSTPHAINRPVFVIPRDSNSNTNSNSNTAMSTGQHNNNFVMLSQGRRPPSYDSVWTTGIYNERVLPPPYS